MTRNAVEGDSDLSLIARKVPAPLPVLTSGWPDVALVCRGLVIERVLSDF